MIEEMVNHSGSKGYLNSKLISVFVIWTEREHRLAAQWTIHVPFLCLHICMTQFKICFAFLYPLLPRSIMVNSVCSSGTNFIAPCQSFQQPPHKGAKFLWNHIRIHKLINISAKSRNLLRQAYKLLFFYSDVTLTPHDGIWR